MRAAAAGFGRCRAASLEARRVSGILCVHHPSGISPDSEPYLAALRRMSHRGADGEGRYRRPDVFLGVRWSAVGRGSNGAQPVVAEDGRIAAALDGHVHNRDELIDELRGRGYPADLSSDAALALGAYAEWGDECFARLDGVWALVLWDERARRLLVGRDPLGVRPLYYYAGRSHLLVASEIKSILALDHDARAMDHRRIARLVLEGRIDDWESTCFARVRPVSPGTALAFHRGETSSVRFWRLRLSPNGNASPAVVLDTLVEAVERHTPADVPVGLALSGGIDSSGIAGIVTRLGRPETGRVHAFSINPPMTTDESFLIDATVRHTGIPHTYVSLDGLDHAGSLARLIDFHDEPIQYSGVFYQFVLRERMARAGCRAVLVGYGADEIFGGYPELATPFLADLLTHRRFTEAARFVRGARAFLRSPAARIAGAALRHAVEAASASLRRRAGDVTTHGAAPARRTAPSPAADVLAAAEDVVESGPPARGLWREERDVGRGEIFLRALLDCFRNNVALLVRIEDRNAMAHGLDLCAPFMDVKLVRAALTLPAHRFMEGGWNKAVLRAATRELLAPEVVSYPQKLATPGNDAYVAFDALGPELLEALHSESFHRSGLWSRRCEALYRADAARRARGWLWFRVYATHRWYERVVRPAPAG
jgi:asparagine synthase (glutamine-hydrolysing)